MPLCKKVKKEKPAKAKASDAYTDFSEPSLNESRIPRVDVASAATKRRKPVKNRLAATKRRKPVKNIKDKQSLSPVLEATIDTWLGEWYLIEQDFEDLCDQFTNNYELSDRPTAVVRQNPHYWDIKHLFEVVERIIENLKVFRNDDPLPCLNMLKLQFECLFQEKYAPSICWGVGISDDDMEKVRTTLYPRIEELLRPIHFYVKTYPSDLDDIEFY